MAMSPQRHRDTETSDEVKTRILHNEQGWILEKERGWILEQETPRGWQRRAICTLHSDVIALRNHVRALSRKRRARRRRPAES